MPRNGELSRRLETAQQRLELAVARTTRSARARRGHALAPLRSRRAQQPQRRGMLRGAASSKACQPQGQPGRVRKQLFMQSAPATAGRGGASEAAAARAARWAPG